MAPRRKRQRISEDGASATTAVADAEEPSHATASPSKATQSKRQLFIRSIAHSVTTEDLTEFFSENYPIKYALVVLDKETKASKGYGFVTFADAEDAQRAKEEFDGAELQGKKIRVELAEARHRDADTAAPAVSAGARAKAEREQAIKENQAPKLIVRNLPWSVKTPEQLQKLFLSYGKVHFTKLPKKPNGELRGFGFVALRGKKNAEKAMEDLNGKEVDGRQIAVDWAVDKEAWQDLQKQLDDEEVRQKDGAKGDGEDDASSAEDSEEDKEDEDDDDNEAASDDMDEDDSNTDYEDVSDGDEEGGIALEDPKPRAPDYTVFIRNLPFTADDDSLFEHFKQFGPIAYARVVMDHETDRPKGTGFVRFYKEEDMINCLKGVPSTKLQRVTTDRRDGTQITIAHSVLENEDADPSGLYTMDGRVLQLTRAVEKNEAVRLTAEGQASRFNRDKDKRRLYLLSEGTLDAKSPLYQKLSPSEVKMRQDSADQRKRQIEKNPALHLSLTRLAVRNIPRTVTSKDLKALARQAVVGFAADVKHGKRQRLSVEELARGGDAMLWAEKARKRMGKGIVKQAKVVFETPAGSKITEESGAGRSRGYGFIEYYTHRSALMGLRWLNGHAVDYKTQETQPKSKKAVKEDQQDKRKRLIVEFAIENANVVARRSDRETKANQPADKDGEEEADSGRDRKGGKKRKRESGAGGAASGKKGTGKDQGSGVAAAEDDAAKSKDETKQKLRAQIIQKKRMARRTRKQGKA
ncbi:RNA-binding domain-containing protein [Paraphaeosphaeria sporulosa]|uniref:RNA-binding domain-containing protein n=1 Tax=Paraphaeosphaeria sporulosa TaxID=1460663 RepID=A0A177CSP2_9PLEO|nr:RNA-binding domain-containing protein [Paraphaeosphaeria sporulosa]OAG09952.1 RNA-binding domain-containing protein [Paraphaeosphaeria sporulosa]